MNATTTRSLAAAAAIAVTAALLAGPAYAQNEAGALTREAVIEQVRAAQKAGQLLPAGEAIPQDTQFAASTKTRLDRKAETLQARRNGEFPAGGMGLYKSHMSAHNVKSVKSREQRKAETMQAVRQHQMLPAGEAG